MPRHSSSRFPLCELLTRREPTQAWPRFFQILCNPGALIPLDAVKFETA